MIEENEKGALSKFLFPDLTKGFFLRVITLVVSAWLFFSYVCIPIKIQGLSMEPLYKDGGFNFIWAGAYYFSKPKRGDVVAVRFTGTRVLLLKRIIAFEGERIEFIEGTLYLEGEPFDEPYVELPCNWDMDPRIVEKGTVYVIGDHRSVPIEAHVFGQSPINRLVGVPLW